MIKICLDKRCIFSINSKNKHIIIWRHRDGVLDGPVEGPLGHIAFSSKEQIQQFKDMVDLLVEKSNKDEVTTATTEISEKRLARVATEKKGDKIEADLDGRNATRKTVLVDEIIFHEGVSANHEDNYVFYHGDSSLDATVEELDEKRALRIKPNDKQPNK